MIKKQVHIQFWLAAVALLGLAPMLFPALAESPVYVLFTSALAFVGLVYATYWLQIIRPTIPMATGWLAVMSSVLITPNPLVAASVAALFVSQAFRYRGDLVRLWQTMRLDRNYKPGIDFIEDAQRAGEVSFPSGSTHEVLRGGFFYVQGAGWTSLAFRASPNKSDAQANLLPAREVARLSFDTKAAAWQFPNGSWIKLHRMERQVHAERT